MRQLFQYTAGVTRWLSDDEQRAWRAFVSLQAKLNSQLNRELQAESDLSLADFEVLVHLTDRDDGRVRAFELAKGIQWEKSRLSHHLARMKRRGLIDRVECDEDARGSYIELTPEGRRAIEHAAPGHVETVRRLIFDQLTPEQVQALRTISETVLNQLD